MNGRRFPLGEILSLMTGSLLCDLGGLYRIASYLVGREVYTHELPEVFQLSAPEILAQHPDLAEIAVSRVNPDNWREHLARWVDLYGPSRELRPIGWNRLAEQSPVDTLIGLVGADKVIVMEASDGR